MRILCAILLFWKILMENDELARRIEIRIKFGMGILSLSGKIFNVSEFIAYSSYPESSGLIV